MANQPQATICPVCGQPWPTPGSPADRLIDIMRAGPDRDVYVSSTGRYFVSRGGGAVDRAAVYEALDRGLIVEKWPGKGHEYWRLANG